jgi:bifunctional DNA-binding transcriptional regulator/antitoxin component of YhaV-PrlF toxin-antitoxin module
MALVKVKSRYQVTLPNALRRRVGVAVGDLLEAKVEKGKITLGPVAVEHADTSLDDYIQEGLKDYREGRCYGPFDSAEAMVASLRANLRKRKKATTSSK